MVENEGDKKEIWERGLGGAFTCATYVFQVLHL